MGGLNDADDPLGHFRGHIQRLALGDGVIDLFVHGGGAGIEGVTVEAACFLVLDELFGAVNGIAVLVLEEMLLHRLLRIFAGDDVGHLVFRGGALEGAQGTPDLQIIGTVSVGAADLHIHHRLAGGGQQQLAVVVGVAAGQSLVQLAEYQPGLRIEIQEAQGDAHGVGAGVIQAAGALFLRVCQSQRRAKPL